MKEFADDNFKFDENGRKFFKQVENTVGKGEIARYEQFLLFSQCFQKACFPEASKGVIVWECVKRVSLCYSISVMAPVSSGRKLPLYRGSPDMCSISSPPPFLRLPTFPHHFSTEARIKRKKPRSKSLNLILKSFLDIESHSFLLAKANGLAN